MYVWRVLYIEINILRRHRCILYTEEKSTSTSIHSQSVRTAHAITQTHISYTTWICYAIYDCKCIHTWISVSHNYVPNALLIHDECRFYSMIMGGKVEQCVWVCQDTRIHEHCLKSAKTLKLDEYCWCFALVAWVSFFPLLLYFQVNYEIQIASNKRKCSQGNV